MCITRSSSKSMFTMTESQLLWGQLFGPWMVPLQHSQKYSSSGQRILLTFGLQMSDPPAVQTSIHWCVGHFTEARLSTPLTPTEKLKHRSQQVSCKELLYFLRIYKALVIKEKLWRLQCTYKLCKFWPSPCMLKNIYIDMIKSNYTILVPFKTRRIKEDNTVIHSLLCAVTVCSARY